MGTITTIYDIFNVLITLLDLFTDILVIREYYITGRESYALASLTIICITQLCYCVVFSLKYGHGFRRGCFLFLIVLPFAPILPFIIYFHCYSFKRWKHQNHWKHLCFIIEGITEAFAESVLQLIALIHYAEYNNYIVLFSILCSMINVSSKLLLLSHLSVHTFVDRKKAIFSCICCITDYFAIFSILIFTFYVSLQTNVIQIWTYNILYTVAPFILTISIGINAYSMHNITRNWKCYFKFIFIQFIWFFGSIMC
eukprot:313711_1